MLTSVASLATLVSAPKGPVLPDVASGIVVEPASTDADPSPSPAPLAAVIDFSASCRALGTLTQGPQALPPPRDQPEAARQSGRTISDPPCALRCIRTFGQSPKRLRSNSKTTPTRGYLPFGLPVYFFESARPIRAPRCGCGVDPRALEWRSVLLYSRPLFLLLFQCFLHS